MKKIVTSLFSLVAIGVSAQEVNIQYPTNATTYYGQDINSGSAKYIGMGGAVGALGGDISSVEQNPAGLGVAINSEVQVTAGVSNFINRARFKETIQAKDSEFNFQQFGGTFVFNTNDPSWNRIAIGVNYNSQNLNNEMQLGRNENIAFDVKDENGALINTYRFDGYAQAVDGWKSKFSLNFASSYEDKLFLGLGLNFHETNFNSITQYAERADQGGQRYIYNQNGSPYSENGQGFSFSLGGLYKFNHNVRAGLAYHSPVWYDVAEDYYQASFASNGDVQSYNLYSSDYRLTTGGRAVGSLGFVLGKNLSVGADYTYHMNKDTKFKPSNNFASSNRFVDNYLQDSHEVRLGAEFREQGFKARIGYNYVGSPYKDLSLEAADVNNIVSNTTLNKPFQGDINRLSFGVGYDFGGFYIDAAYQYQQQKYSTIIGNATFVDYDLKDVDLINNYTPHIKLDQNLFLVTLGWQF